jgi:DNA-binding PadR family transcriptional regulator
MRTRAGPDPSLLVMASLASGPKHGYALTKDIEEFSGSSLGPGTLYACVARLEERGLIEPVAAEGRRRPYRLTAAGRAELRGRLVDAQHVVRVGLDRLGAG